LSFVILGAYAPPGSPATGDAGAASLPLLFVLAAVPASGDAGPASLPLIFSVASPVVVDPPDPEPTPDEDVVDWRDHSPDLLLAWGDATADTFVFDDVSGDTLVLVDHAPTTLLLAEPSLTTLEWADHVPTSLSPTAYGAGLYGAGKYGGSR
jgi:hypothetical protein